MRFDPTPFYRSTVGFDRLFNLLDGAGTVEGTQPAFPPYNIERLDEDSYRITMAVAGFDEDELSVEVKENSLTIKGEKATDEDNAEKVEILHRGIAGRNFERRFQLADHMVVDGADLKNGLLHVSLNRIIPEEKKARKISIGKSAPELTQIEATAA